MKYLAQKALISYLKFVYKAANKKIFNIKMIDAAKLAEAIIQMMPMISAMSLPVFIGLLKEFYEEQKKKQNGGTLF